MREAYHRRGRARSCRLSCTLVAGMARRAIGFVAFALVAFDARADIIPNGAKTVKYSYEITNLAEHPEITFVMWPRMCGSGGEPLGEINYVNPEAKERHAIDYQVLGPGTHDLLKYCARAGRVYALDAKAFPTDKRMAEEDDWRLGLTKGHEYFGVQALDKMTIKERVPFFAAARRADYAFEYVLVLRQGSPITAIHDVLTIKSIDAKTMEIAPSKVEYTYVDGKREELAWTSGKHPRPPGKPDALRAPSFGDDEDEDLAADAPIEGKDAGLSSPAIVPTPPSPWPSRVGFAAIVVGVGAGIGFSVRRKKGDS